METAEQNKSKQVSAKVTALWDIYKYLLLLSFFFFEMEWVQRNGVEKVE